MVGRDEQHVTAIAAQRGVLITGVAVAQARRH
jgi:hypothetical protein